MDTSIKTQNQLASVKQFNCTNCGNALSVLHPRAQYISCQYCGSVLDLQSEEHQILKQLDKPGKHNPFSFIQLGQFATFNGKSYQVISRTRWRQKYKEYWQEEGERGYSDEVWVYDEWLLIDTNRTYFYLIEDKEGYWISEEVIPETPMLRPKSLKMSFYKGQSPKRVREYGMAEVIFFEGESNYQIQTGDRIEFSMFKDRSINYSAEWRMKDKREIKEIEFFKETPISRRRLLEAFDQNEAVEQLKAQERFWRFIMQVGFVAAAAMLALGMFALFDQGTELTSYTQRIPISNLSEADPLTIGPLELTEPDLYRFSLKSSGIPNGSEIYVFAYILDEEKLPINTLGESFYLYSGYEDGESYTEQEDDAKLRFKLEEPSTFYVQLYRQQSTLTQGEITFKLYQGVRMARYFFIVMGLGLLVGVVARARLA